MRRAALIPILLGLAGPAAAADAAAPASGNEASNEAHNATQNATLSESRILRIAVSDFEATDVDPAVASLVADAVVAELRKHEHLSVIGMQEIRDMLNLEAEKQALGCDEKESCLAEIAGALGVDLLVTGTLAHVGEGSLIGMRRIDQREAKVTGTFNERLPRAGGDEFFAAVGPAVEQLFPDHALREGQTRGVSEALLKRLNPPPVPVWGFWTLVGSSAVVGGVALTTAGWWATSTLSHVDLGQRSISAVQSGQAFKALEEQIAASAVAFYVSGGVALALAATTTGAAFLTDWEGYGERE